MTQKIEVFVSEKKKFFGKELDFDPFIMTYIVENCFGKDNISNMRLIRNYFHCDVCTDESDAKVMNTVKNEIQKANPTLVFRETNQGRGSCSINTSMGSLIRVTNMTDANETDDTDNEEDEKSESVNEEELKRTLGNIKSLIGWEDLKRFATETLKCRDDIFKHQTRLHFMEQNYLIAVNGGCGFTHGTIKMAEFLHCIKLTTKKDCYEYIIGDKTEGEKTSVDDIRKIIEDEDNYGDVMTFDISALMSKDKEGDLRHFIIALERKTVYYTFIFRIPYVEPKELKRIESILRDVLLIRTFIVPPFNNVQYQEAARRQLNYYDFQVEDEVWPIFDARIREEKSDGSFYGFRTVNKIVDEMVLTKHLIESEKKENKRNAVISASDMAKLSETYGQNETDAFEELDSMVGMEDVSKRLKEIVAQVKLSIKNEKLERPCMHMRFVGAPGTGKTTVARIVGKIFAKERLLSNGHFIEHGARDFCGQYIGQTAPKTSEICRDAYGSVLFIDEAYDLYRSTENNDSDYGREALAVLIAEMENHRDDMVVIMAGYKKDMDRLMQGNQGLASRIPFTIEFKSYTKKQLVEIFMRMAKKNFKCADDLEKEVAKFFEQIPQEEIDTETFSNARYVRNLYERTWSKAAMRIHMEGSSNIVLTVADFKLAVQDKDINYFSVKKERNKVGFR